MVTPRNPNAFLGQSSITGGGYVFATNITSLLTNSDPQSVVWDWSGEQYNLDAAIGRSEFWAKWVEIIFGGTPLAVRCQAFPTTFWIRYPDNANYADLSTAIFLQKHPSSRRSERLL